MTSSELLFDRATPVLRVSDYARARDFYTEALGFQIIEEAGEPVTGFGIFRAGTAQVFLQAWDGPEAAYTGWRAYFYPRNFQAFEAHLRACYVAFTGPTVTEYGMREIQVMDPDGNVLCFGEDA